MGDFNDILYKEEKEGGIMRTEASMSMFRDFVKNCGTLDMGFSGAPFTRWNKRSRKDAIKARLDRVICDLQWSLTFHRATCFHLEMVGADHCPLFLDTRKNKILSIEHGNRVWQVGESRVEVEVLRYFNELFSANIVCHPDKATQSVDHRVTDEMNRQLTRAVTSEEVKRAMFKMLADIFPGPDGMTVLFSSFLAYCF
ncbi:hypothetical protein LIER_04152 [Lithospermum erythrorhizon]|uniref:Reverse transcriptase n=1 Tax=Lithospermum erythrorhizon TaxID=34254 RepID=A0AAV3NW64_LITER